MKKTEGHRNEKQKKRRIKKTKKSLTGSKETRNNKRRKIQIKITKEKQVHFKAKVCPQGFVT